MGGGAEGGAGGEVERREVGGEARTFARRWLGPPSHLVAAKLPQLLMVVVLPAVKEVHEHLMQDPRKVGDMPQTVSGRPQKVSGRPSNKVNGRPSKRTASTAASASRPPGSARRAAVVAASRGASTLAPPPRLSQYVCRHTVGSYGVRRKRALSVSAVVVRPIG